MALRHGLFVSGAAGGVTAPQDARLALAALLSGPGLLNGGSVSGSTSGPNMKYTIATGAFVTQRGVLATDGLYVVPNDGPVTQDSGAPAPSSGTRWDLVWVRQPNAFGSDGFGDPNSDPTFGVTVGTAASTPAKPYATVPAGALVLAESLVGTSIANASLATISQVAAITAPVTLPATPTPARRRNATSALGSIGSAGVTYPVTTWGADMFNVGDIAYAGGVFTVGAAGIYRWSVSFTWPVYATSWRARQYVLINGTKDSGGEQDFQYPLPGAQTQSCGFEVSLAAGGTVQAALEASSAGVAGIIPTAFSLVRVA